MEKKSAKHTPERSSNKETPKPQNKIKIKFTFKKTDEEHEAKSNSKLIKSKTKKTKNRTNESPTKDEIFDDDVPLIRIVPSLRTEPRNGDAPDEEVSRGSGVDDGEDVNLKSIGKKGKIERLLRNQEKRKIEKDDGNDEDDDEDEEEKSGEDSLYKFPMNRVSRIVKSEILDHKISQEAVFVINRASEKFLELLCGEAYARALRDRKKQTDYNHLSSVVSKRRRFRFLSDFVPEKIKAEEALAQTKQSEK